MSTEYKQKSDIIDLYSVLGLTIDVCNEPNCDELIHGAFLKASRKCHPDKNRNNPEIEELFILIQGAYDILKDAKQRGNYNHKVKLDKQSSSSYFKLKQAAVDYSDGTYKEATEDQKLAFQDQKKLMNAKYGYNEEDEKPIPKKDAKKILQSRLAARDADDIDYKPEKIFDGDSFNAKRFNAAFDMAKKQTGGSDGGSELMPSNGIPSAWNDAGSVANFSQFDDLNNLFVDDKTRFDTSKQSYGGLDFGSMPGVKLTQEYVSTLSGGDYYDQHGDLGDDYYTDIKKKLAERQASQNTFENMGYNDFRRDDTAGYGIHDQLGFKFDDKLTLDLDEDDIAVRFDKIMAERQKTILPPNNQNKSNKSKK